jgi:Permuted papain-like amidase enzyme, YaeF/YiiX, C92 family
MAIKENTNLHYRMRWPLCCLIFLLFSCNNPANNHHLPIAKTDSLKELQKEARAYLQIAAAKEKILTGDLIVRTGNDFTSESLRSLNQRNKTYSHCGIASIENDTLFVYHALGGEFNPDQQICRDRFEFFADPITNRGIGVYRYQLAEADIRNLMITVKKLKVLGVTFDMKFDLQTNDKMYCAEFVYKSYLMGTNGKLQFSTSRLGDFTFIGVDDLFLQPLCTQQQNILYK